MSLPPYLTEDEIAGITDPLTQGAARIKYIRALGVKAEKKPNGQPLVWRADFDAARQRNAEAANDDRPRARDWKAFEKRIRCGRGETQKRREPARPRAAG
jgi:hypothetical protein